MKKIIILASVILAAVAVFSCAKEQNANPNSDNSNYEQKDIIPRIYSVCYLWWQIEGNDTVCVNYHYENQPNLVLCGAVIPNNPEC